VPKKYRKEQRNAQNAMAAYGVAVLEFMWLPIVVLAP
jgi:membrane protein YqaA with SNARE-associated domain